MPLKNPYPLLERTNSPAELRTLSPAELITLTQELREFLIESVSKTGGHLAAGLGTIELTIALHKVYDTPRDRLVWDVGHQSYPHKVLTGRREQMSTIRKQGGLAGFPKRSESDYDSFGVGHSSTSISAALGMALASSIKGEDRKSIAIIGDGAMTAGMAFEALNHAGHLNHPDLLVILNDNEMSISKNVGALSQYLARILSSKVYSGVKEGGKKVLAKPMVQFARRWEEHMKGMVVPGTLFEELGFDYFGPVDGHDLPNLIHMFENLKKLKGPRLLHLVTKKGKGYKKAEEDPCVYHGVSPFDPHTGTKPSTPSLTNPSYTAVFSQWLCDMAAIDKKLVGITPAMSEGSGLVEFAKQYPERYFDVAIAEQHAVTLSAGLACEGLKPVVAIYSTFLQRAYDQLIHDVVLQNLSVLFAIDRAGLVGADGPTHAGSFDLSFMRCLPNLVIMAASDANECRQMLYTGHQHNGPAAVRYPRGSGPKVEIQSEMELIPLGRAEPRRQGKKIALLAFGSMLTPALQAAERLDATVINMRFVKPLDENLLLETAKEHQLLVTLEENAIAGGAGSGINEYLLSQGIQVPILNLGLPDQFSEHGVHSDLLRDYGLDAQGIVSQINTFTAST
ncbi:MAG: 1-deoxy-D-xylulose-5-phosphate synthase [Gammaproteobacteria bacterium]|nr:1-deoxy-D-xylulose-5-phosphate synthase [Gammaproteobacteria bacterium]